MRMMIMIGFGGAVRGVRTVRTAKNAHASCPAQAAWHCLQVSEKGGMCLSKGIVDKIYPPSLIIVALETS